MIDNSDEGSGNTLSLSGHGDREKTKVPQYLNGLNRRIEKKGKC